MWNDGNAYNFCQPHATNYAMKFDPFYDASLKFILLYLTSIDGDSKRVGHTVSKTG